MSPVVSFIIAVNGAAIRTCPSTIVGSLEPFPPPPILSPWSLLQQLNVNRHEERDFPFFSWRQKQEDPVDLPLKGLGSFFFFIVAKLTRRFVMTASSMQKCKSPNERERRSREISVDSYGMPDWLIYNIGVGSKRPLCARST